MITRLQNHANWHTMENSPQPISSKFKDYQMGKNFLPNGLTQLSVVSTGQNCTCVMKVRSLATHYFSKHPYNYLAGNQIAQDFYKSNLDTKQIHFSAKQKKPFIHKDKRVPNVRLADQQLAIKRLGARPPKYFHLPVVASVLFGLQGVTAGGVMTGRPNLFNCSLNKLADRLLANSDTAV